MPLDLLLVNPGDKRQVYQDLGADLAAIEPPYWSAVVAAYLRRYGVEVAILDANAENLSPEEAAAKAASLSPRLVAVLVYGNQPSASTQNMTAAGALCRALRARGVGPVAIGGLHPTALPRRTMEEEDVDFLVQGEGLFTLRDLLTALGTHGPYDQVPGLWYREGGELCHTAAAPLVRDLDQVLPTAAWDLLPMPLYRAHNWHCFDRLSQRQPYAALYTSLGCPYGCVFCCINALFGQRGIRYRSPGAVVEELGVLVERYGVRNVKIIDELFVLDPRHYLGVVDGILERGYDLNIWAYARVDTVKPDHLERMRRAGITWLALGIESANPEVREGASKAMRIRDIRHVVDQIHAAGIHVIGNYIFGLPDDTHQTLQETLDMAMDLDCEFSNFYCAMAYPGSKLYDMAVQEGWALPQTWHGYSQHGYDLLPLPTRHLSAREVLAFRDEAFHRYTENPSYLSMLEEKFGGEVRRHVHQISTKRLHRRLLSPS